MMWKNLDAMRPKTVVGRKNFFLPFYALTSQKSQMTHWQKTDFLPYWLQNFKNTERGLEEKRWYFDATKKISSFVQTPFRFNFWNWFKMLKIESIKLKRAFEELKSYIFLKSISDKKIFLTREIYDIIRDQFSFKKKIIFLLRALPILKFLSTIKKLNLI